MRKTFVLGASLVLALLLMTPMAQAQPATCTTCPDGGSQVSNAECNAVGLSTGAAAAGQICCKLDDSTSCQRTIGGGNRCQTLDIVEVTYTVVNRQCNVTDKTSSTTCSEGTANVAGACVTDTCPANPDLPASCPDE